MSVPVFIQHVIHSFALSFLITSFLFLIWYVFHYSRIHVHRRGRKFGFLFRWKGHWNYYARLGEEEMEVPSNVSPDVIPIHGVASDHITQVCSDRLDYYHSLHPTMVRSAIILCLHSSTSFPPMDTLWDLLEMWVGETFFFPNGLLPLTQEQKLLYIQDHENYSKHGSLVQRWPEYYSNCGKITDEDVFAMLAAVKEADCEAVKASIFLHRCPQLTDASIIATIRHFLQMVSLIVSCTKLTGICFLQSIDKLDSLTSLEIACTAITDAALIEMARRCPRLTSLNISVCSNLTPSSLIEFVRLHPYLQKLYANRTFCINDEALQRMCVCVCDVNCEFNISNLGNEFWKWSKGVSQHCGSQDIKLSVF